jgi:hypothetical protein
LLRDFLQTWETTKDGRILGWVHGQEIFIDHVLIREQLGISKEGALDATNPTFEEAKTALKRIIGPHAENEHWSVVRMKEEFHVRFITNLWTFYQREKLAYFNNQIVITFDLANRGQPINWCSIMLTQLLVELICWIEHQKKAIVNPISNQTKIDNYYSKPILDIPFRKWFSMFDVPSPRPTIL